MKTRTPRSGLLRPAHVPDEYRTSEAAALLGVSRPHLSRLINAGRIPARKVGSHWRISARALSAFQSASRHTSTGVEAEDADADIDHIYPAVYRDVLFGLLDGERDCYFDPGTVSDTPADRDALEQLVRGGAVIEWGDGMSLGRPYKALLVFAAAELARPHRMHWSPPDLCREMIDDGRLVPGSAPVVLRHFALDPNPIGAMPETVWHGRGPTERSGIAHAGWTPWMNDGLTERVPLAVAYADLFCVSDWRADEFADYTLRKLIPQEG